MKVRHCMSQPAVAVTPDNKVSVVTVAEHHDVLDALVVMQLLL